MSLPRHKLRHSYGILFFFKDFCEDVGIVGVNPHAYPFTDGQLSFGKNAVRKKRLNAYYSIRYFTEIKNYSDFEESCHVY